MIEDPDLKQSLINAYYYLDLMYFFDSSRNRSNDVLFRDAFDFFVELYTAEKRIMYERILVSIHKKIFNYLYFMTPVGGIISTGKLWYEQVKELHNIDGVNYSDGKGVYIMSIRTDYINTHFNFNINNLSKLPYFRHALIEHIFDTSQRIVIGSNFDTLRLLNQMVYFFSKTSLFIRDMNKYGLIISMLLDSSERAAFTFVESFLESVGIDNLLGQGFKEPFDDVEPKRLKCLISAETKNNSIKYCQSLKMVDRLEIFIKNIKNDANYINTDSYYKAVKRYSDALEIRHLLTHSGYYRADNTEMIMERKYTEVYELLTLVLELSKSIWTEVYDCDIPFYFYDFSLDKIIEKVTKEIQYEIDLSHDIVNYKYVAPVEPRFKHL